MADERAPVQVTQDDIKKTPLSPWYKYTLFCGHEVYTRVRLSFRGSFNEHFIRCPQCESRTHAPTSWQPVEKVEAASDEQVSHVHGGSSFVLPRRIMRTDGPGTTTGTPFPYASADRDY